MASPEVLNALPEADVQSLVDQQLLFCAIRGLNPFSLPLVRKLFEGEADFVTGMTAHFDSQRQRLEVYASALENLRLGSTNSNGPHPDDLTEFTRATFEAFGIVARFVPYASLRDEPPLAGAFYRPAAPGSFNK